MRSISEREFSVSLIGTISSVSLIISILSWNLSETIYPFLEKALGGRLAVDVLGVGTAIASILGGFAALVSIWKLRHNKSPLLGLTVLFAMVSFLVGATNATSFWISRTDLIAIAVARDAHEDASIVYVGSGVVLFDGYIGPNTIQQIAAIQGNHSIRRIVVRSYGGLLDQSLELANLVESQGIQVHVRDYCMSACIAVVLASEWATANREAVFGFHRTSVITDVASSVTLYSTAAEQERFWSYLRSKGLPQSIVLEANNHSGDSTYIVDAEAMSALGLLGVTD